MSFFNTSSKSTNLNPNSVRIGLIDPNIAQTWAQRVLSNGATVTSVTKGDTINHTTSQPSANGLFCQRIFGPCTDYTCACGHEKIRIHVNVNVSPPVCPECQVEWTVASVRRQRLGSIELLSPVTHKWFSDSRNYIPILTGFTVKTFKSLKECKVFFPFPFSKDSDLELNSNSYHSEHANFTRKSETTADVFNSVSVDGTKETSLRGFKNRARSMKNLKSFVENFQFLLHANQNALSFSKSERSKHSTRFSNTLTLTFLVKNKSQKCSPFFWSHTFDGVFLPVVQTKNAMQSTNSTPQVKPNSVLFSNNLVQPLESPKVEGVSKMLAPSKVVPSASLENFLKFSHLRPTGRKKKKIFYSLISTNEILQRDQHELAVNPSYSGPLIKDSESLKAVNKRGLVSLTRYSKNYNAGIDKYTDNLKLSNVQKKFGFPTLKLVISQSSLLRKSFKAFNGDSTITSKNELISWQVKNQIKKLTNQQYTNSSIHMLPKNMLHKDVLACLFPSPSLSLSLCSNNNKNIQSLLSREKTYSFTKRLFSIKESHKMKGVKNNFPYIQRLIFNLSVADIIKGPESLQINTVFQKSPNFVKSLTRKNVNSTAKKVNGSFLGFHYFSRQHCFPIKPSFTVPEDYRRQCIKFLAHNKVTGASDIPILRYSPCTVKEASLPWLLTQPFSVTDADQMLVNNKSTSNAGLISIYSKSVRLIISKLLGATPIRRTKPISEKGKEALGNTLTSNTSESVLPHSFLTNDQVSSSAYLNLTNQARGKTSSVTRNTLKDSNFTFTAQRGPSVTVQSPDSNGPTQLLQLLHSTGLVLGGFKNSGVIKLNYQASKKRSYLTTTPKLVAKGLLHDRSVSVNQSLGQRLAKVSVKTKNSYFVRPVMEVRKSSVSSDLAEQTKPSINAKSCVARPTNESKIKSFAKNKTGKDSGRGTPSNTRQEVYFSSAKSVAKEQTLKKILCQTGGGGLQKYLENINLGQLVLILQHENFEIVPRLIKSQLTRRLLALILNKIFNDLVLGEKSYNTNALVKGEQPHLQKNDTLNLANSSHLKLTSESLRNSEKHFDSLEKLYKDLKKEYKIVKKICRDLQNRKNANRRRYKLAFQLFRTMSNPAGMTLSSIPILPPGLRPIIDVPKIGPITADLNIRYRSLIFALRNLQELAYVDFRNTGAAQASVQEAVDDLLYTGGKTRQDKGIASVSSGERLRATNLYKSLAMRLKGKHGRFRGNLLGKRVDYSGRSVIVVGPTLKIHQCGLPFEIAIKLFNPFLIRRLLILGLCKNVYKAKQLLMSGKFKPLIWSLCREVMYEHLVLLNRAPTLHRLGVQAFMPILVSGRAILLHPLVCTGFNADFDGDQMGVHVPLFPQARAEAWKMMWSRNNFLSPSSGEPILLPSQDMVLGCYYLTETSMLIPQKNTSVTTLSGSSHTFSTKTDKDQEKDKKKGSTPRKHNYNNLRLAFIEGPEEPSRLALKSNGDIHKSFHNLLSYSYCPRLFNSSGLLGLPLNLQASKKRSYLTTTPKLVAKSLLRDRFLSVNQSFGERLTKLSALSSNYQVIEDYTGVVIKQGNKVGLELMSSKDSGSFKETLFKNKVLRNLGFNNSRKATQALWFFLLKGKKQNLQAKTNYTEHHSTSKFAFPDRLGLLYRSESLLKQLENVNTTLGKFREDPNIFCTSFITTVFHPLKLFWFIIYTTLFFQKTITSSKPLSDAFLTIRQRDNTLFPFPNPCFVKLRWGVSKAESFSKPKLACSLAHSVLFFAKTKNTWLTYLALAEGGVAYTKLVNQACQKRQLCFAILSEQARANTNFDSLSLANNQLVRHTRKITFPEQGKNQGKTNKNKMDLYNPTAYGSRPYFTKGFLKENLQSNNLDQTNITQSKIRNSQVFSITKVLDNYARGLYNLQSIVWVQALKSSLSFNHQNLIGEKNAPTKLITDIEGDGIEGIIPTLEFRISPYGITRMLQISGIKKSLFHKSILLPTKIKNKSPFQAFSVRTTVGRLVFNDVLNVFDKSKL